MITISDHAREAMERHGIGEEELHAALEHGARIITDAIDGEIRYGNELPQKECTIVVIYTYREDEIRVITCYTLRRKREP